MKIDMQHDEAQSIFLKCPRLATGNRFQNGLVNLQDHGMTLDCHNFQFHEV